VLALSDGKIAKRLDQWRAKQTKAVAKRPKD
jgi:phosphoribosylcarboxyaminoimidazole (NCAIR) mutase